MTLDVNTIHDLREKPKRWQLIQADFPESQSQTTRFF